MAADMEKLVVQLSADIKKYENALNRAMGVTNRQAKAIENRFVRMNKRVASSMSFSGSFGRGLIGGLAAGFSAQGVQQLLDSATKIQNSLKVAGLSGKELEQVYDSLFVSAQKNAVPLEALVTLYGRAAQQQKELGVSSADLVKFTDNIGLALRVAGTDATTASGALLQLGQALGSGTVHAEEFSSILEGAPTIVQAAAAGIDAAGGSVAKLKQLVVDGQVSSKAFFDGFETGAAILRDKVAGSEITVSAGFARSQNVLVDVATRINDSTDASQILANFLSGPLSDAIRDVGGIFSWAAEGPIGQFIDYLNKAVDAAVQASADLGQATGLAKIGERFGAKPYIGQGRIQDRIDGAFAGTAAPKSGRAGTELTVSNGSVVKPITLADYPVTGGKSGRSRADRPDDFQREIEQIKERTAAIQAETAAMAGVNPLIDDYGYAIEKARAKQDLLTSAQKAGIAVTPQLEAQIDSLAEGYANASVAAEQLAESQDKARQTAEEMRDLGKDVMGGFIHDLLDGKSAADALAGALGKIGDKLLDMAMNDLFGGGGGSGGGLLSMLFGGGQSSFIPGILSGARVGLFHKGGTVGSGGSSTTVHPGVFAGAPRYHSGGIAGLKPDEVPAILQKGEVVLPRGAQSPSGGTTFAPVYHIDARGADAAAVARLQAGLDRTNREMQARIVDGVRKAQKSNVKLG
jgi:tape measure domain-containing protein